VVQCQPKNSPPCQIFPVSAPLGLLVVRTFACRQPILSVISTWITRVSQHRRYSPNVLVPNERVTRVVMVKRQKAPDLVTKLLSSKASLNPLFTGLSHMRGLPCFQKCLWQRGNAMWLAWHNHRLNAVFTFFFLVWPLWEGGIKERLAAIPRRRQNWALGQGQREMRQQPVYTHHSIRVAMRCTAPIKSAITHLPCRYEYVCVSCCLSLFQTRCVGLFCVNATAGEVIKRAFCARFKWSWRT